MGGTRRHGGQAAPRRTTIVIVPWQAGPEAL